MDAQTLHDIANDIRNKARKFAAMGDPEARAVAIAFFGLASGYMRKAAEECEDTAWSKTLDTFGKLIDMEAQTFMGMPEPNRKERRKAKALVR